MSWNKSAEKLFGFTATEIIGCSITRIIPPERLSEEIDILRHIARGERVEHFDTIRMRKDGTRINVSLMISPVRNAAGIIVGASKVVRDITERVRQDEALREVNIVLRRANVDLEYFAYSASHDLQEPLRMVATYSELLRRKFGDQFGKEGNQYIDYVVEGAVRMQKLLSDLRLYTQISTAEQELPGNTDSNEILRKILQSLEVVIEESGATIAATKLPCIPIHAFQLEQLFQNLIANAIRYRSSEPPRIDVGASREEHEWMFSVKDNGIGIEPKYKEQIFGVFKRLHTSGEYPGTGMGLAICQRIVERIGGRIWVESEQGVGSTFYFTVPFRESGQPVSKEFVDLVN